MAKKKEAKAAEEEVLTAVPANDAKSDSIEEMETVKEPVGKAPEKEQGTQPRESVSRPRTAAERQRAQEEATEAMLRRQTDAMIVGKYITASKRNAMLSGVISGVETRDGHAFWIIYDGPVIVMVPFREALPLFMGLSEDITTLRQRQLLSKSIGAEIQFTVEQLEMDESAGCYYVFGSRCKAVERIAKRHFGETATEPAKIGDTMVGTFMSVGVKAAWIYVNGVDTRVTAGQLSHRYMANLQEHYRAGDQIRLCWQQYDAHPRKGDPHYLFSALPCELEECKKRHNLIRKHTRYIATITSHRVMQTKNPETGLPESYYSAAMWIEGINVPAYANVTASHASGKAHSGDQVQVEVEDIAYNGYVRCRIRAYLPR